MKLEIAKEIALKYKNTLLPFCERIEIGGSIRREKPEVGDIEIICIPKKEINDGINISRGFVDCVEKLTKVKGEPTGKYTQRMLPEGIALDLFIANKDNWGFIYAMRTGSADYFHYKVACRWVSMGYRSSGGVLYKDNIPHYFREEEDLFKFLNLPFIGPEKRK